MIFECSRQRQFFTSTISNRYSSLINQLPAHRFPNLTAGGTWPDPLPPVAVATDRFALEPGRNLVLWLNLTAPPQARPGLYRGQVKFLAGGKPVGTLALQVRVGLCSATATLALN